MTRLKSGLMVEVQQVPSSKDTKLMQTQVCRQPDSNGWWLYWPSHQEKFLSAMKTALSSGFQGATVSDELRCWTRFREVSKFVVCQSGTAYHMVPTWKKVVGRLLAFWDGFLAGAMLMSGSASYCIIWGTDNVVNRQTITRMDIQWLIRIITMIIIWRILLWEPCPLPIINDIVSDSYGTIWYHFVSYISPFAQSNSALWRQARLALASVKAGCSMPPLFP